MTTDRFTADKTTLRAALERRARTRQVITYGEAAALVGRSTAGLMPVRRSGLKTRNRGGRISRASW